MRDAEEFWEELLAQIEAGQVIPVIGPELLRTGDGDAPLYRVLAERLLAKYGLAAAAPGGTAAPDGPEVPLRPGHELNDAVCALAQRGRRVQDLYRPVHDLLRALLDEAGDAALQPLRELAGVSGFGLFVSTTPDDLLARALDERRAGGSEPLVFAPKLASGTLADLPEAPAPGYAAVCYLFGRMTPSPFLYAIHDEDILEFLHTLQINGAEAMKRLFSALRTQNLLLIGCDFPDWLSRFFIRLSNTQRLADARGKREFLTAPGAGNETLTLFLERFSPDTWVFPGEPRAFVAELARRWQARHPEAATGAAPAPFLSAEPAAPPARADATFFVSYARDDLAAAQTLFAELRDIGADVAWFDKTDLKPGDDWEQRIRAAIAGCHVFIPLVSARTEAREEGFFREEWTLAAERSRRIQGRTFLLPVAVDRDYDGNAGRYRLVPESFLAHHFGHAPEGEPSPDLLKVIIRLLRERRSQRSA